MDLFYRPSWCLYILYQSIVIDWSRDSHCVTNSFGNILHVSFMYLAIGGPCVHVVAIYCTIRAVVYKCNNIVI